MRAIGWVLLTCVILLTACRSVEVVEDLSTWDGRFEGQIELVDDVGLPDFEVADAEVRLRDGAMKWVFWRRLGRETHFSGELKSGFDASTLTAEARVWLDCAGGEIRLHRRFTVTEHVLIGGVLQLPITVRTSDLPEDFLLVHGRAVTSDGTPVAGQSMILCPPARLNAHSAFPATTDDDGRFARLIHCREEGGYFERGELRSPDELGALKKPWRCAFAGGTPVTEFDWFEIQPRKELPWHANFGEFTIGGALVELAHSPFAKLHFRSGNVHRMLYRTQEQVILPPGRYTVYATNHWQRNETYFDYCDVIELKPGQHLSYAPPAHRAEMVEVKVFAPEQFNGRVDLDGGSEGGGVATHVRVPGKPALVPRFGRSGMIVQAVSDEYEEVYASLPPGVDRVSLGLESRRPAAQKPEPPLEPWVVRVSVDWPEELREIIPELFAVHTTGLMARGSGADGLSLFDAGEWKLYLVGGGRWGYPGGVMDGPVVVNTDDPDSLKIKFKPGAPPIPNPLWDRGIECECGGNRVSLTEVDASIPIGMVKFSSGLFRSIVGFIPTALFDGLSLHPVEYHHDEDRHRAVIDLPPRVRVRVTGAQHSLPVELKSLDSTASCHTTIEEGEVALWLPPGKAILTIGRVPLFTQEIDVKPGKETLIDWTADYGQVILNEAWDPKLNPIDEYEDPQWAIYRITEVGEVLVETNTHFGYWMMGWQDPWGLLLLPSGHYVARTNSSVVFGEKQFHLQAGERIEVELKASAFRPRSRVRMNSPDVSPGFMSGAFVAGKVGVDWRFTADGLELGEVPVDARIVVSGWFSSGGRAWYLEPLTIEPGYSGDMLEAQWREARWAEAEWFTTRPQIHVRLSPDAPWLPLSRFWIPPGDSEMRFDAAGGDFAMVPVRIDGDSKLAPMPEDLRQELERGWGIWR